MNFSQNAQERLAFAGLTPEVRALLPELFQILEGELPGILDRFYDYLDRWPALAPLLSGHGKVESLKRLQSAHWRLMFSGRFDAEYFDRATAIGRAHQRIRLAPHWYIGGYTFLLSEVLAVLATKYRHSPEKLEQAVDAATRTFLFDMELATSVYIASDKSALIRATILATSSSASAAPSVLEGRSRAAKR